jgi:hypothetical protein
MVVFVEGIVKVVDASVLFAKVPPSLEVQFTNSYAALAGVAVTVTCSFSAYLPPEVGAVTLP